MTGTNNLSIARRAHGLVVESQAMLSHANAFSSPHGHEHEGMVLLAGRAAGFTDYYILNRYERLERLVWHLLCQDAVYQFMLLPLSKAYEILLCSDQRAVDRWLELGQWLGRIEWLPAEKPYRRKPGLSRRVRIGFWDRCFLADNNDRETGRFCRSCGQIISPVED